MSDQGQDDGVARRDVLKGLAGAGTVATGVAGAGRGFVAGDDGDRYLVGIDPGVPTAATARADAKSRALSVHRELDFGNVRTVVAGWYTDKQRDQLEEHSAVAYIERDVLFEPHQPTSVNPEPDDHGEYPWGIERIAANTAHDNGATGAGTDITIIDTGISPSQYALEGNVGSGKVFGGHTCVEDDRLFGSVTCEQSWDDDQYHGTHVAGIAGGAADAVRPTVGAESVFVAETADKDVVTGQQIRDESLGVDASVVTADGENVVIANGNVETESGTDVVSDAGGDLIDDDGDITSDEGDISYSVERDGETIITYTDDGTVTANVQTEDGTDVVPEAVPAGAVDRIAGVAPDATLHAANVFQWTQDSNGDWAMVASLSDVAAAIEWATDQGHDVVNASLGGSSSTSTLQDALAYATEENNVVFVASAGNDGQNCDSDDCVSYPAAHDDAIAVANTTDSDDVATSSSRGPEVEVAAPGTDILSTAPPHVVPEVSRVDLPFWKLSGTSMAAPHVAGLAALVKAHTDLESNTEIRTRLRESTEDIGGSDVETGSGLVDTEQALAEPQQSLSVSTSGTTAVGQTDATLQGELTDLGGASEADVYFEYRTEGETTWQETSRTTQSETGPFETTVSELQTETTYEFRAAAETGSDSDTGGTQTFTTEAALSVVTETPTAVGTVSATLQGTLENLGGANTVAAAFVYWEEGSEDRQETLARTLESTGSYEVEVDELAPETTYECRATAVSDQQEAQGETQTFTTDPTVSVTTTAAVDVTRTGATLQGQLDELGSADSADVFFEFRPEGTTGWQETGRSTQTETGAFEQAVSELDPETTYEFRAAVVTESGADTGERQTFTTELPPLAIETIDPIGVSESDAALRADLTELGSADSATVRFEYGEVGQSRTETEAVTAETTGPIESTVTGLAPETTYVYNAVAETADETDTGGDVTFETDPPPLSVRTVGAVDVGDRHATLQGELDETGDAASVAVRFEYWADGSDDREETLAETLDSPGPYQIEVNGLDPETTYQFRALATTDQDSATGEPSSFTTDALPLAVETGPVTDVGEREATVGGEVTELGAADEGDVYFEYWVEGAEERTETEREMISQPETFETAVTNLEPDTPYRVRAVAETPLETAAGDIREFSTDALPLTVDTGRATRVQSTSATVTGEVTALGETDTVSVVFEYGPIRGHRDRRETPPQVVDTPQSVEAELTDLKQDTTYEFSVTARSGAASDSSGASQFQTPSQPVALPTVDTTDADTAVFSQRGDGYRIRAPGQTPWDRPRDRHGYGALYEETQGEFVIQTTIDGLYGSHDTRMAGFVVSNDLGAGGGVEGDLLLVVEPEAGVSLVRYDETERRYETVAGAEFELSGDLRLSKRGTEFTAEVRQSTERAWSTLGSVTVPGARATQEAGLFATSGHESSRAIADFGEFLTGDARVALLPAEWDLPPDRTATFDLAVENADRGVQSYSAELAVEDPEVARIEDISLAGLPVESRVTISEDGSGATISAGMGAGAFDPGDVTVATVTLVAETEGTTGVTIPEITVVNDESAVPYEITSTQAAQLTVRGTSGPPPVVGDTPPQDIDGDGLYEDVNGDGRFTVTDVHALFRNRRTTVVKNNAEFFNFDGREPPTVTLADVVALSRKLSGTDAEAAAILGVSPEKLRSGELDPADVSLNDRSQTLDR